MSPRQLIAKVWGLCGILRDGGTTYQDYITELSWLLYLALSSQTASLVQDSQVRNVWPTLLISSPDTLLATYQEQLDALANSDDVLTSQVFTDAKTRINDPAVLAALLREIEKIEWGKLSTQALGDIYEGILERNALEQKSGAGQYFTPRTIVDVMVEAIAPEPGEIIQDPAAGTGGFLVAAANYVRSHWASPHAPQIGTAGPRYHGLELVPGAFRLCLMNLSLHAVPADVVLGSALSPIGANLPKADIILTNPPFGSRRGADTIDRTDLTFPTTNKQLAFLQHVYKTLKDGGRAAIVVPDGVLFDRGIAKGIRQELLKTCDLHTILRLPAGLFYATGVKTSVLFFTKRDLSPELDATEITSIYDARSHLSAKTQAPKVAAVLADFAAIYGLDSEARIALATTHPRLANFSRSQLRDNDDNLDLHVRSVPNDATRLVPLGADALKAVGNMRTALSEALALTEQLESMLMTGERQRE